MVAFDELVRLHEHAARAAARVIDDALIGLDELGNQLHDAGGRVELAVLLGTARSEDLQEVLVDAPDEILLVEACLADLVDCVYERLDGANLCPERGEEPEREGTLEGGVDALCLRHRVVDLHCNVVCAGVLHEVGPACLLGKVVDVRRIVECRILEHLGRAFA